MVRFSDSIIQFFIIQNQRLTNAQPKMRGDRNLGKMKFTQELTDYKKKCFSK